MLLWSVKTADNPDLDSRLEFYIVTRFHIKIAQDQKKNQIMLTLLHLNNSITWPKTNIVNQLELKEQFFQKWIFCHRLLTLVMFKTCEPFFLKNTQVLVHTMKVNVVEIFIGQLWLYRQNKQQQKTEISQNIFCVPQKEKTVKMGMTWGLI